MSQDLVSFVLRFVREVGEDQQARWRGVIKHVQGNTESSFTQFSEALAFMQDHVNEVVRAGFESAGENSAAFAGENPFLETARLWGEFMPKYTRLMMDTMGGAVPDQAAFAESWNQAMGAALKAWGMPTQAEQQQTVDTLSAMTDQLAALNAKVEVLEARLRAAKENSEAKPAAKPKAPRRRKKADDEGQA